MKIQLMSDLHLEHYRHKNTPPVFRNEGADVLILAGDIHVGLSSTIASIRELSKLFPSVIYVAGNHEHYDGVLSVDEFSRQATQAFIGTNVNVLSCRERIKIKDVTFFGGTLWTNFRNDPMSTILAKRYISDFSCIKDFSPSTATALFEDNYNFIKDAYEHTDGKKVIVSHFLPATQCISARFQRGNEVESELNKYFANDLGDWIETLSDTTWVHGHTHDDVDVTIGTTRIFAKPSGYPGEFSREYQPLIFEV